MVLKIWLISNCIVFPRFVHVVACIRIPFLFRPNHIVLYIYTTFALSIHLMMDIWVVFTFWLLWMLAMNIALNISVLVPAFNFGGIYIEVESLNHVTVLLRNSHFVSHSGCTGLPPYLQRTPVHWYFIKKNLFLSCTCTHTHTHTHAISLSSIHWTYIIYTCQVSQEKIGTVKHSLNNNKTSS